MNGSSHDGGAEPAPPPRPVKAGRAILLVAVAAAIVAASGIMDRSHEQERLAKRTAQLAVPTVSVFTPKVGGKSTQLTLPGNVEAFYSAAIHGQTSGYLSEWRKDIGARVHAGDVLAVVDTPELEQRIVAAEGELAKAKANLALAQVTAQRWSSLGKSAAVSQQAVDEKESDAQAKKAELDAAEANLAKLKAQRAFDNITAPFDGVVTARNVDVGALVRADSTQAPLFVVADVHQMRIYVPVPEAYAAMMKPGMHATLELPEYPNRKFDATIDTTSNGIDQKSRTLLVELLADNKDGALQPGAFARVHFELPSNPNLIRLPANALLFYGQRVKVAIVGPDDKITLKPIKIARDLGNEVEIDGGLSPTDRIVASPPETIADGDKVRIAPDGEGKPKSMALGASGGQAAREVAQETQRGSGE